MSPKKAASTDKAKPAKKPAKADAVLDGPPVLNIGLVGHVDHGKTTLTERLSGKWTDTHSEELRRGITIRLGYADVVLKQKDKPVRKVSLVDAPGHESLMATMLSGATIMDGVLLLVAANEHCPQPQTREHVMALNIMGIQNVIIVQNKIDLVKKEQAIKNHDEIKKFIKGTSFENAPIIPISAKHNVNMDLLIDTILKKFAVPKRDVKKDSLLFIARSFDVNKPGSKPEKIVGGVLGGALIQGKLKKGDRIEIRPGRKIEKGNKIIYESLFTTITGIKTGGKLVDEVTPGGSLGIMTQLDPGIVKSDALAGNVVGHEGKMPPVHQDLKLEVHLLKRVVGAKSAVDVEPLKMGEPLMLNVNAAATVGVVTSLGKNKCECKLKLPVCAAPGQRVTISRRLANRFRLIGYGTISV